MRRPLSSRGGWTGCSCRFWLRPSDGCDLDALRRLGFRWSWAPSGSRSRAQQAKQPQGAAARGQAWRPSAAPGVRAGQARRSRGGGGGRGRAARRSPAGRSQQASAGRHRPACGHRPAVLTEHFRPLSLRSRAEGPVAERRPSLQPGRASQSHSPFRRRFGTARQTPPRDGFPGDVSGFAPRPSLTPGASAECSRSRLLVLSPNHVCVD